MSILHWDLQTSSFNPLDSSTNDNRFDRDILGDIKHGLDLIFELKNQMNTLHPIACETLIRLMTQ